ncbi:tRNA modification GTPase mnmE [Harpegnathos saltator]|uniref:tRNA modification GTPase mnmE n=1 Tax=Harpegnathos saltator TaxID=610380 RepID=E2B9L9_HARSA|nr:tRNA modification GTPase mnmE [Harpegnathos saltator]
MKTIFALSSGLLPSGVAVIRLSGAAVKDVLQRVAGFVPEPRMMVLATFRAESGEVLDRGLVVYFPAPKSFTGEDCAEFHLHGGKAVVTRFLDELSTFPDCRVAEAGEFSRRAFAEGKFDLTEAEGLADLIHAETESQRRLAMMGASGALADLYRNWRSTLVQARAMIEAELDFADEGDVPGSVADRIWDNVSQLHKAVLTHIESAARADVMRDGVKIVIAGAPNAGKSSVINRLAARDVAIVTEEAGTTRDALEIRLVLGGLPVLVTDTAGLRQTENHIEKMGIESAAARIGEADLILLLDDMHNPQLVELPPTEAEIWSIGNKLDLGEGDRKRWPVQLSARSGAGWQDFIGRLTVFCRKKTVDMGEIVPVRRRHTELLKRCALALQHALYDEAALELRAEHLRLASDALGKITGDIDVEDLLNVIFSEFCIGK